MKNSVILVVSDFHAPYNHPDAVDFLAAIKKEYKPDRIVVIGDEVDHHAMSFHDSDPDLLSAGHELEKAIEELKPLYKLFPEADIVDSNHGSMHYRKGKHHGIPRKYLKGYNEILDAPIGWKWSKDLVLKASDGSDIYFHHGLSTQSIKIAQQMGMKYVQGHFHSKFEVQYSSSPDKLIWSMTVGCLVDDHSMAFNYNKTTLQRPIIGVGLIINGHPVLMPMQLAKGGRWIGELR